MSVKHASENMWKREIIHKPNQIIYQVDLKHFLNKSKHWCVWLPFCLNDRTFPSKLQTVLEVIYINNILSKQGKEFDLNAL